MRKAQISMNMIVYIAIALLVLVMIVAFVMGGFGEMFKGLSRSAPQDLESIQSVCTNDCNKVKASIESSGASAWASSSYAKVKHGFDINKDGDVTQDEYKYCWESPINVACTKNLFDTTGTMTHKCKESTCTEVTA